jgi:hypothetical protein
MNDRYKWIALSNTTLGVLLATLDASITLIAAAAHHIAALPPVAILFAAFLGYNPIQHLVGPHVLDALSAHDRAALVGRGFFPHLISGPFQSGLHAAFGFAILACLVAAAASLLRGGQYRHGEALIRLQPEEQHAR